MDVLTPEQRTRNMRAIKYKNTRIEELLAGALWKRGYRYRRNSKTVFGKPDFSFIGLRIAVFCDSEYFHGKNWKKQRDKIKTNTKFWQRKIESNIKRDNLVNKTLNEDGWKVIRFWGEDIKKRLDICLSKIEKTIEKQRQIK